MTFANSVSLQENFTLSKCLFRWAWIFWGWASTV